MSGEGMSEFVNTLTTGYTMDSVFGAITPVMPVVITLSLIALTVYVVRRVIKRASKGKGGM